MSRPTSTSTGSIDGGIVAAGFISLLLGGVFFWSVTGEEPGEAKPAHPMAFAPIEVDADKLQRARSEQYGQARRALESGPADKLLKKTRRLNELQFPPDGDTAKRRALGRELSYSANEVIPRTGYAAFIAAGEPMIQACSEGLDELLSAVESGDLTIDEAKTDPPADSYAQYRENCGRLLPLLVERGLVTEAGTWAEPLGRSKAIAGILQRLRWASMIRDRRPALMQLTDYERRLLMRWRIEDPKAYSVSKRQQFVARLVRQPDLVKNYDGWLAKAKLAWSNGERERAAQILRDAIDARPDAVEPYEWRLHWIEEKLSEADGEKSGHPSGGPAG